MRLSRVSVPIAVALFSTGCGGGGGPTPVTVTIVHTPTLVGSVHANGDLTGGLFVGDLLSGGMPQVEMGSRGFVSFDLSSIPAGAMVLSATLRLTQKSVISDPYGTLGDVVVDQMVYSPTLDAGAYSRTFPVNQGIVISTDATNGLKTASVTPAVKDDVDFARGRTEFRIRFETELDGNNGPDLIDLNITLANGELPTLVVTYLP